MDELAAAAVQVILVLIGRVIVRSISFGHWDAEPLRSDAASIYGAAGALSFVHEGRRVITHTGQMFAGVVGSVCCIAAGIALYAVAT